MAENPGKIRARARLAVADWTKIQHDDLVLPGTGPNYRFGTDIP
jgi:hypothetical protein